MICLRKFSDFGQVGCEKIHCKTSPDKSDSTRDELSEIMEEREKAGPLGPPKPVIKEDAANPKIELRKFKRLLPLISLSFQHAT